MRLLVAAPLALVSALAMAAPATAGPLIRTSTGANNAAIQATVDQFRSDLGALNANTTVVNPGGRREINWDGVPPAQSSPNPFPADFFNVNSPRGVVLSTPGTGFEVSDTRFSSINANYPTAFGFFSALRIFTARGSTTTDVSFFLPGSTTPATVSGFGVVFTDVDTPGAASVQYFDAAGNDLGTYFAPVSPTANSSGTLSFLGVNFAGERVARARITSGNGVLGPAPADSDMSQGGVHDVVAMDDFIYAEPEPGIALTTDAVQVDETSGAAASVTVTRTASPSPSTVTLRTADGTAQAGSDYTAVDTTVSFAPNETSQTVTVPILADSEPEKSETFSVSLSNPVGAGLTGAKTATVTIDQPPPGPAPPVTITKTVTVAPVPPLGSLGSVPATMKLKTFLKGVKFQVLRNTPSAITAALEGSPKKATIAAAKFNLALASKSVKTGTGRTTITLKPPKSLVGSAKKLTVRVHVVLTNNGASVAYTKTIKVKG